MRSPSQGRWGRRLSLCSFILFSGVGYAVVHATVPEQILPQRALVLARIDADELVDTITATFDEHGVATPAEIRWGNTAQGTDARRLVLRLPAWHGLRVGVALDAGGGTQGGVGHSRVAATASTDSLAAVGRVILHIRGTDADGLERSSAIEIAGGAILRRLDTLALDAVGIGGPSAFMRELRPASGFSDPAVRSFGGGISWRLDKRESRPARVPHDADAETISLSIYPSPASGQGRAVVSGLRPGANNLLLHALDGRLLASFVIEVDERGTGLASMDFSELPSGVCLAVVMHDGRALVAESFIITR